MLKVEDHRLPDTRTFPDPLDEDHAADDGIVLTRRCLVRLALVACETGARFARDGVRHDPMTWMLAPRRLFGGRTAIDACLELEGCNRAIILHGLALGLDADADEIDNLLAHEPNGIDEGDDGLSIGTTSTRGKGVGERLQVSVFNDEREPFLKQDAYALEKRRAA